MYSCKCHIVCTLAPWRRCFAAERDLIRSDVRRLVAIVARGFSLVSHRVHALRRLCVSSALSIVESAVGHLSRELDRRLSETHAASGPISLVRYTGGHDGRHDGHDHASRLQRPRRARYRRLAGTRARSCGADSQGIGYEIAKGLAASNARVLVLSRRPNEAKDAIAQLEKEVQEATGRKPTIEWIECDLSDLKATRKVAEKLAKEERIDAAVMNAGVGVEVRSPRATRLTLAAVRADQGRLRLAPHHQRPLAAAVRGQRRGKLISQHRQPSPPAHAADSQQAARHLSSHRLPELVSPHGSVRRSHWTELTRQPARPRRRSPRSRTTRRPTTPRSPVRLADLSRLTLAQTVAPSSRSSTRPAPSSATPSSAPTGRTASAPLPRIPAPSRPRSR